MSAYQHPSTHDPIRSAIEFVVSQQIARAEADAKLIRDEIKQNGTYWAADEILKLRSQLAAAKARAAKPGRRA